jgi:cytochrome c-type biogenesis protein CcmH/NrfF
VAEINIERKPQRNIVPWILGLVLLLFVIWALVKTLDRRDEAAPLDRGSAASEKVRDTTPPHLRQYA